MKIKKTVYDDRKDATELADCIEMTVNSRMNLLCRLSVNDALDFQVLLIHLKLKPTLVVILINFSDQFFFSSGPSKTEKPHFFKFD